MLMGVGPHSLVFSMNVLVWCSTRGPGLGGRQPWPPSSSVVPCQLGRGWMDRPRGLGRWRRWSTTSGRQAWAPECVCVGGGGAAGSWCLRTALSGRYPPGSVFQVITALNTGFFELCSQGFFF